MTAPLIETSWSVTEGDCIAELAKLPAACARLVFADPPYNIGIDYGSGKKDDRLERTEYLNWCVRWIEASKRVLTHDGSFWLLCDARWAGFLQCIGEAVGLAYRETIIWHETFGVHCENRFGRDHRPLFRFTRHPKRQVFHPDRVPSARQTKYNDPRANPRGRVPGNVWTISRVCGTFKERLPEFPTQLPLDLLRKIIKTASDPGDLIIDPFSGSATTGVAAVELGRRYHGIELRKGFADASRARLDRKERFQDIPHVTPSISCEKDQILRISQTSQNPLNPLSPKT